MGRSVLARMTAVRPSGGAPSSRAISAGASGQIAFSSEVDTGSREENASKNGAAGQGAKSQKSSVQTAGMLGVPGRAGAAHIMQFRAIGVERPGEELAKEGAEFCKGLCQAVAAVRRGVEGCRTDRSHDASLFCLSL